jgi:ParB/RepB/Spo0J family partition protein
MVEMGDVSHTTGLRNLRPTQLVRCPIQFQTVRKETMEYLMLRDSIRDVGIIQPLLVRPAGDVYEVVAGNHRFEVAMDLRLPEIPCLVREMTDFQVLTFQVIENSNRIESRPVDYVRRLQKIVHNREMTVEQLAFTIHRHPDWVRKLLSLNYLSPNAKKALDKGEISCTLGIEMAKLPLARQDQLLGLTSEYTARDFLELLRGEVRDFRGQRRTDRISDRATDMRGFRRFREVKHEHVNKIEKATVLTRCGAKTASEGWDAAFDWILSVDEHTLAERVARRERGQRLEAKRNELRNLEQSRRLNYEQRTDD